MIDSEIHLVVIGINERLIGSLSSGLRDVVDITKCWITTGEESKFGKEIRRVVVLD